MEQQLFTAEFWDKLIISGRDWIITELPSILIIIILLFVLLKVVKFSMSRIKKTLTKRAEQSKDVDHGEAQKRVNTLTSIIEGSLRIALMVVFFIMLFSKFGVDIGPLLAGAGVLGLAIGFGAQQMVGDYIAGFFMLLEDQVRAGDVAIVNGTGGLVEKIELRTITLRDLSGVVHIFQNGKISTLANMTKDWSAMVFDIGVAYKEDVDTVMEIIKQVGEDLKKDEELGPNILEPIEIFGLDKFADSALVIKARLKTKPITQWATGREYRRRLKIAFDKQNIEIPFPHTTVYWGEEINPLTLSMDKAEK